MFTSKAASDGVPVGRGFAILMHFFSGASLVLMGDTQTYKDIVR